MAVEPVVIDLGKVGGSIYAANEPGFLQIDALKRVLNALNAPDENEQERVNDRSRPVELNVQTRRRHDAILISARRGEGKTTFLYNVLRTIEDGSYKDHLPTPQAKKLYSLGMIDPTLIENKQNIIIVIIDLIRLAAEHHRKEQNHTEDDYRDVQRSLRKLAQGLTILDGIGDTIYAGREWVDPEYVLDQGLLNASAAHGFERSFQDYVRTVVKYVNHDAFVLAIDDVDTWFERGWPVLEALRKYLATPELKIILSGDLNLYSLLVRRQQWAQMTDEFLKAEDRRGIVEPGSSQVRQIGRMIDSLQDQYLTKVAPPEKRIDLRSLEYHAERSQLSFIGMELDELMDERFFIQLVSDHLLNLRLGSDAQLVRGQILRMPIRSALHTLRGVAPFARSWASMYDDLAWSQAMDALRHVAWTALMTAGVDVNESRDADPAMLLGTLAEWLTRSRLWLPMARFLPDGTNDDQNRVAIYYSAVLANTFRRRPSTMIDFWLKICTVREKVDGGSVDYASEDGRLGSIDRLVRHLNLASSEKSIQTVSRLAAWDVVEGARDGIQTVLPDIRFSGAGVSLGRIRSDRSAPSALYGSGYGKDGLNPSEFVGLAKKSQAARRTMIQKIPEQLRGYHERLLAAQWEYEDQFDEYFANGVEDLSRRLNRSARIAMLVPSSRIVSGQNYEFGNYSVLRLIGFVGDLMACADQPDTDLRQQVRQAFAEAIQSRSYPAPASAGASAPSPGTATDPGEVRQSVDDDDDEFDDEYFPIEDLMTMWLSAFRGERRTVAPVTLGRMWTRFTYASASIRLSLKPGRTRYLGYLVHRTVVAFLHAVGLEAIRAADITPPASISSNALQSSRVFVSLLKLVYETETFGVFQRTPEFAFFDMLFSCPMWSYFLAQPVVGLRDQAENGQSEPYGNEVIRFHRQRMERFHPAARDAWPAVRLESPRGGEDAAEFFGLFHLLNTVPMQGNDAVPATAASTRVGLPRNTASGVIKRSPGIVKRPPPGTQGGTG